MLFDTIKFIDALTSHMSAGSSVLKSIEKSAEEQDSSISRFAIYFLRSIQNGGTATNICLPLKVSENKILFMILDMGIKGYPIQQTLLDFHKEVLKSNELEIEAYHKTLPFKLFLPLVFFYFPSIFVLFLGPFLADLMNYF